MKFFEIALLVVAGFAIAQASNAFWGNRTSSDLLGTNELVFRNATANQFISADVYFPRAGQSNTRIITAIYVYDRYTNGKGASASLWSGGPGYTFATINLKSQFGQGINSTVEFYVRR